MTMPQQESYKPRIAAFAIAFFCALGLSAAQAAAPEKDADIERMTDYMITMVPLGEIFESLAKKDPLWPMQEKPEAVSAEKLQCLRRELSKDGYRRMKRLEVEAYANKNPSRVASDLELLGQGGPGLFGKLVMAGAESEETGVEMDPMDIMKAATPLQMSSFITFFQDPNYAELRKLSGVGDALSAKKSAEENQSAGEQLGASIASRAMLAGMSKCDVPMSVLF
jgi:hypothetical protein